MAEMTAEETAAATRIAAMSRGHKDRKVVKEKRRVKKERDDAITKLQATMRGRQARRYELKQLEILEGFSSELATKAMREECEAEGIVLPSEDELNRLSAQFNGRLEVVMPGKDRARSWYILFKEIDDDESGLITFDELTAGTSSSSIRAACMRFQPKPFLPSYAFAPSSLPASRAQEAQDPPRRPDRREPQGAVVRARRRRLGSHRRSRDVEVYASLGAGTWLAPHTWDCWAAALAATRSGHAASAHPHGSPLASTLTASHPPSLLTRSRAFDPPSLRRARCKRACWSAARCWCARRRLWCGSRPMSSTRSKSSSKGASAPH